MQLHWSHKLNYNKKSMQIKLNNQNLNWNNNEFVSSLPTIQYKWLDHGLLNIWPAARFVAFWRLKIEGIEIEMNISWVACGKTFILVWFLTKFMLTMKTHFDTSIILGKIHCCRGFCIDKDFLCRFHPSTKTFYARLIWCCRKQPSLYVLANYRIPVCSCMLQKYKTSFYYFYSQFFII